MISATALGLVALLASVSWAAAEESSSSSWKPPRPGFRMPVNSEPGTRGKLAYFDQLIDHNNPSMGTFQQEYWYSDEYYGGPGRPIVMWAPSENTVTTESTDLSDRYLPGYYAKALNAGVVQLQHRYFGNSTFVDHPYNPETMQLLNLDQVLLDITYFANNVKLRMDPDGASNPNRAPWILMGCSYPGALTAWVERILPGTFWAYHAGSAVVQAISEMWTYYLPSAMLRPPNCTADRALVIDHVDTTFTTGSEADQMKLKEQLGLPMSTSGQNVASAVSPDHMQFWIPGSTDDPNPVNRECDYIENQYPMQKFSNPGPQGVGLEAALAGYKEMISDRNRGVFMPAESEKFASSDNDDPWSWMLCNEPFEWFPTWSAQAPFKISKLFTRDSAISKTCDQFKDTNGFKYRLKFGITADLVNQELGGYLVSPSSRRLLWVNGELDPWRGAGVEAFQRPTGPFVGVPIQPSWIIQGGTHCNDWLADKTKHEPTTQVVRETLAQMQEWVGEFYKVPLPPKWGNPYQK